MKVRTKTVRSAGGVVLRGGEPEPDVLLIATHERKRWSLPKGRIEGGESPREAALREVKEETGIEAALLAPLETIEYWFYASRSLRLHKYVEYFLMRFESGVLNPQLSEVDDARWWPYRKALELVAYKNDRRLLESGHDLWVEKGYPATRVG